MLQAAHVLQACPTGSQPANSALQKCMQAFRQGLSGSEQSSAHDFFKGHAYTSTFEQAQQAGAKKRGQYAEPFPCICVQQAGKVATAEELQKVISNLQEERKSSQIKLAKQAEREQRIAAAVSDAHAAAAKVKVR